MARPMPRAAPVTTATFSAMGMRLLYVGVQLTEGLVQQARDLDPVGMLTALIAQPSGASAESRRDAHTLHRHAVEQAVLFRDQLADLFGRISRRVAAGHPPRKLRARHGRGIEGASGPVA